jgi:hypothetical protein
MAPRRPMPLSQICEQVRLGRYRVPAEVVADAILGYGAAGSRRRRSPLPSRTGNGVTRPAQ